MEVALDLELRRREHVADVVGELQPPPELLAERGGGKIRHVSEHASDAHSRRGRPAGAIIMPLLPVRIRRDGVAGDGIPRDALRLECVGARDGNDRVHLIAVEYGPFERLHPAQGTAGNGSQPRDSQLVQQCPFGPHHVGDRDDRKVGAVGPSSRRIGGRGPCGPSAPAQQVRADDEKLVRVERLPWANHAVPPAEPATETGIPFFGPKAVPGAFRGGRRGEPRCMGVAAERMAHQNHVVTRRREPAVGLVGNPDGIQLPSAVERERFRELEELRGNRPNRARGALRRPAHASDHIRSKADV